MSGSFQIMRAFDIPVRVHWSFALVLGLFLYYGYYQGLDWGVLLWNFLLVSALFFCVVLHEFGHALTARYYGVRTKDIILLPIGGLARLDRLPDKPIQEFLVAAAGPAVNLVIALFLMPYLFFAMNGSLDLLIRHLNRNSNFTFDPLSPLDSFIIVLIIGNVLLAVLNLIPAFPMDGGRILRALLSIRLGRLRATRIATYFGQFIAGLFVVHGIFPLEIFPSIAQPNILLSLIGLFVFFMASNEYNMTRLQYLLGQHSVREITRRKFTKLYTTDTIGSALHLLETGLENSFLVFDQWQNFKGILSEKRILEAAKQDQAAPVGIHYDNRYEALLLTDDLASVYHNIQRDDYTLLPVYEYGKIIGVVDQSMLIDFIRRRERKKA